MKKIGLLLVLPILLAVGCMVGCGDNKDYGTLVIDDMVAMREGGRDIRVRFSKPECAEKLTYTYDSRYIDIKEDENRIIAKKEGQEVEVTAESEHFKTTFKVKTDYMYFQPVINAAPSRLQDQVGRDLSNATVFIGDSFFDHRDFWNNFYNDVVPAENKNVFLSGISSSTIKDWFVLSDYLLYNSETMPTPENIVIHLGSNDLWYNTGAEGAMERLKELITDMRYHCPETSIYFISTENRTYAQVREHWNFRTHDSSKDVRLTMQESLTELLNFHALAKEYCEQNENVHFVDTLPHFTNDDYSCDTSKFRGDGCHPAPEQYAYYVNALIEAGLDDIKLGVPDTNSEYSFEGNQNQDISETIKTYMPNGEKIIKDTYLEFDMVLEGINAPKGNMFIDFAFDDAGNRFLLWRSDSNDNFYLSAALGGSYTNNKAKSIKYNNSLGKVTNKIALLLTQKNIYFYLNGELEMAFLNFNNTKAMKVQSCWMDVYFDNVVVYNPNSNVEKYNEKLQAVSEYENSTSTTKEFKYL